MKIQKSSLHNSFARLMIATLLVLITLPGMAMPVRAATLCVAPGGAGGCYATIGAAVAAANSGDTITVAAGTYSERNILINKSLTLLGDPGDANPGPGANAPVLDGSAFTFGDAFLIDNGVTNVTIRGFEIRNYATDTSSNGIGNGISAWEASTSNITIQDNYFHDLGWNAVLVGNDGALGDHTNWAIRANIMERWSYYGFELTNASNSVIENNRIIADTTYAPDISILVTARRNESGITIRGNQITGATNSAYPFIYIYAYDDETPNVNLNNVVIEDNYITATNSGVTPYYHVYIRDINTGTVTNARVNNNVLLNLRARTAATVDAAYNWWGNASGPYDPNDEVGETTEVPPCDGVTGLAMTNADGVSGWVVGIADYCLWNTLPLAITTSNPVTAATLPVGVNQLQVFFNKEVASDGSTGSATNVANYLLFEDGANGVFDTVNCLGGIAGDDVNIAVNSASYNAITFAVMLNINGGVLLPAGNYRLLACGTTSIEDLGGSELNFGIADSIISFDVAPATAPTAIPATGFAPGRITQLGPQAVSYSDLGDLWLEIPRLGVQMPIVGIPQANGDWDVSWLGTSAGWLQGSAFPSLEGNSVLTGHVWNADNSAGPFRYLNTLWYGDRVIVHAFGQEYIYEVRSVRQVAPTDVSAMLKHEDLPWLTLVTCRGYNEATGSYRYRVLVRAVLIEVK